MFCIVRRIFAGIAMFVTASVPALATQPEADPGKSEQLSEAATQGLDAILKYRTTHGLTPLVERAFSERVAAHRDEILGRRLTAGPMHGPAILRETAVSGFRTVPVLLTKFADATAQYTTAELQKQLFESSPTGTITDYFVEVSGGKFTLSGKVFDWVPLAKKRAHYVGPQGCFGMCRENWPQLDEMLRETLAKHDAGVNFADYDNDGTDGVPNSGDDDGIVDFVAVVHADDAGECKNGHHLWSHYFALDSLSSPGQMFETRDRAKNGGNIQIKDYVILPSRSCKGNIATIGVFCHEFGHAFALPDLYDTDTTNGKSGGVGGWDLMGSGSNGGDNLSHNRPAHMSAWSKEYLGWLTSHEIHSSQSNYKLQANSAIKIDIDDDRAYLIEYRRKTGFDKSLLASGLLIWHVKNSVVRPGLTFNSVNADHTNPGLYLVEADDGWEMRRDHDNRGGAGDVFPGSTENRNFDSTTSPASVSTIAICNIREESRAAVFDVRLGANARCLDVSESDRSLR